MTKIIKDAFIEGRTTDTHWDDSTAKQNQFKLDLFTSNIDNYNGKEFGKPIRIQRLDPQNGKVLQTYASRLEAGCWVATNVIKTAAPDVVKKAVSVTGNMHMCISNGWKAYGYYWKYIDDKQFTNSVKTQKNAHNAKMIGVSYLNRHSLFSSIAEAAKSLNISDKTISSSIKNKKRTTSGHLFYEYNDTPQIKSFNTVAEASAFTGLSANSVCRYASNGKYFNNYKLEIKNIVKKKPTYKVYSGNTHIHTLPSKLQLQKTLNLSRKAIDKMVKGQKNGIYRVVVKY